MQEMHKDIEEWLQSGKFMDTLETVYGNELQFLGFWGTEPTLTLPLIQDKMDEVMTRFPKLRDISFSTSMMTDPKILADWVESNIGRELKLGIQISLDGPKWITDNNRIPGASEMIPKNFKTLLEMINDLDLRSLQVEFKWKATHGMAVFRGFADDPEKIKEYEDYFRGLNNMFNETNKKKTVILRYGSYVPTIVVPGKYTSEDGKIFAKYIKAVHKGGGHTTYSARLDRLYEFENELYKKRMFSCSGGDSNAGFDDEIHICHRTFYLNNDKYVDAIIKGSDMENWDVSLFRRGTIEHIRKFFIVDPNNEKQLTRWKYTMRGYHDYWTFQLQHVHAMMIELARIGQVDPIYEKDAELRDLFSIFCNTGLSCPMENLLNTGSIHLSVVSLLRLFGNGAFQEIIREYGEVRQKRAGKNRPPTVHGILGGDHRREP